MDPSQLFTYFPELTEVQMDQFRRFGPLFMDWNQRINLISRKDTEHFYERHVLHSLGIAKVMVFADGTKVMDIGTGGGFPGIPLAILFPGVDFLLVDSIGKKVTAVQAMANTLGLKNVRCSHARAESIPEQFDFIVSRAVTALPVFIGWVKGKFLKRQLNELPNGILYLKGGDLTEEIGGIPLYIKTFELSSYFSEDFFETKKVVYVKLGG